MTSFYRELSSIWWSLTHRSVFPAPRDLCRLASKANVSRRPVRRSACASGVFRRERPRHALYFPDHDCYQAANRAIGVPDLRNSDYHNCARQASRQEWLREPTPMKLGVRHAAVRDNWATLFARNRHYPGTQSKANSLVDRLFYQRVSRIGRFVLEYTQSRRPPMKACQSRSVDALPGLFVVNKYSLEERITLCLACR